MTFQRHDPHTEERAARRARANRRAEMLLFYAASMVRAEEASRIVDVEGLWAVIVKDGEAERVRTLADLAIDPKSMALMVRDGLVSHFEKQAAHFRRLAQDEFGVTADEFRQALRDYDLIAAQKRAATKEIEKADAGAGSAAA